MVDLSRAAEILQKHFDDLTSEEFTARISEDEQDIAATDSLDLPEPRTASAKSEQLMLFQQPAPLRLQAYLACALSGLDDTKRQLMFVLSDMIAQACARYDIDLYEPRKRTDPVHNPDVEDTAVYEIDRDRVLNSDLVIHLCHEPSTGAGEELGFASDALIPIVLISHSSTRVSRMITGMPAYKVHITYDEPEDLRHRLDVLLVSIRPVLESRKVAFSDYRVNMVGERIRRLREDQDLTRSEVATAIPGLTLDALRQIEESSDNVSNPTLIQLRQVATVLKTTVSDLVEPDLMERLFGEMEAWTEGRVAARFHDIPSEDRKRVLRRILLKMFESLDTPQ